MKDNHENDELDIAMLLEKMREQTPVKDREKLAKDIEKILEDMTPEERLVLEKRFGIQ